MNFSKYLRGTSIMSKSKKKTYTVIMWFVFMAHSAQAETCLAPSRPFVPSDPASTREYEDLIRQDFEHYITNIQDYFRCMEGERARAFTEAQEVSQEYGRFVQQVAN